MGHSSSVDPEVQPMLESMSRPSSLRRRLLVAMGTSLAALLVCAFLLPFHSKAFGRSQAAASGDSKAELWPISIDYPQDGSIFPPGITPPTFLWRDAAGTSWSIDVTFAGKALPIHALSKGEH